jgi:hypothetical protein
MQFGATPPNTPGSMLIFSCVATISWKVEGNFVTRQISVQNGATISGTAQAIDVNLQDNTPNYGQTLNQPYQIGIQVTPGTRPVTNQPPLLMFNDQQQVSIAAAGGTKIFDIPQNAGVISMEIAGVGFAGGLAISPNLLVQFFTNATFLKSYIYSGGEFDQFVPVPIGATEVLIVNQDATNVADFSLAWGIDG